MTEQETEPRRRWYQFRLRTLLIVGAIFTIPFAWLGGEVRNALRNRAAAAWVVENSGSVEYNQEAWLDEWTGGRVIRVRLLNTPVSDLTPLAGLKDLQGLNLYSTQVSDLTPLAELKELRILWLRNTPVSDLTPLVGLKGLRKLDLSKTQVSDLTPLAELKNLEGLYLNGTPVSEEQVQMLQKALPNCDISR